MVTGYSFASLFFNFITLPYNIKLHHWQLQLSKLLHFKAIIIKFNLPIFAQNLLRVTDVFSKFVLL